MKASADIITFSPRGQVVIPMRLRHKFGIERGTKALVETTDDAIVLHPITRESIRRNFGKYRGSGLLRALADEKKIEREK